MYALLLLAVLASRVASLFSVHDDMLAFPQYEVILPDVYITEDEADVQLRRDTINGQQTPAHDPTNTLQDETHQIMWLKGKKFLCTIPLVRPPPPMNATEKEITKVEEDRELARATARGWELLSDLEGKCLYFVSGWWSYSFCHNREVRQFHQLPPQANNQWPPTEDPDIQSYVLGKVSPEEYKSQGGPGSATELQATGELRILVHKLGGGTVCDLTGKRRKIEVQFHCNSHGTDRIGWIKEVSICCYLMVIYTPRLCNDVAFLPARENRANGIVCKEVLSPSQVSEYKRLQSEQQRRETQRLLTQEVHDVFAEAMESLRKKAGENGKSAGKNTKKTGSRNEADEVREGIDEDEVTFLLDL